MTIIIGTVLTQPQLYHGILFFRLKAENQILTVIRTDRNQQKLDVLFLCIGQQLILCGSRKNDYILTTQIRILACAQRNYLLENKQNGVLLHGYSADNGTDPGNSEL